MTNYPKRTMVKFTESDIKAALIDYANKHNGLNLEVKDVVGFGIIKQADNKGWYGAITYHG